MKRLLFAAVRWLCDVKPAEPMRGTDLGPPDVWPFCTTTTHYFHGTDARCACGARPSAWMPIDDLDARPA